MIPFKSNRLYAVPQTLEKRLEIANAIRKLFGDNTVEKFDPNQARVPAGNPHGGQWTDGGADEADAGPGTTIVQDIIQAARRLNITARPDAYQQCLDLCYPLLERPRNGVWDRNYWDFQKCMNECLGRNL
jgi:hypothetical protein